MEKPIKFVELEGKEVEVWEKEIFSKPMFRKSRRKISELKIIHQPDRFEEIDSIYSDIKFVELPSTFLRKERVNIFDWEEFISDLITVEILHLILRKALILTKENDIYSISNTKIKKEITRYYLKIENEMDTKNWIQEGIHFSFNQSANKQKLELREFLRIIVRFYLKVEEHEFPFKNITLNVLKKSSNRIDWMKLETTTEKKWLIFESEKFELKFENFSDLSEQVSNMKLIIEQPYKETRDTANFRLELYRIVYEIICESKPSD